MAAIPPLSQIAGQHIDLYEAYYRQVNHSGTAAIGANEAALFMKKSGLKEGFLHRIWDMSDYGGRGYLDKQGFYVALKLIALAQSGMDVSLSNLTTLSQPPKLGESPKVSSTSITVDPSSWLVKPSEKQRYDGIFETLNPLNGYVSGDKIKPVLMNSKLPVDVLGRVWDMSDIDKDGMLDRDEFSVAMHLVYRALDGDAVPHVLPPLLIPPSKRQGLSPKAPTSPANVSSATFLSRTSSTSSVTGPEKPPWVVTPVDKTKFDAIFVKADTNQDGLVSGLEIRDIFVSSGLQQPVLAHIWNLCDIKNIGQLNSEQFALAMYLINQKRNGRDPPAKLTQEMIPPAMREKDDMSSLSATLAALQSNDFSAIKELDQINQDIECLAREKTTLQQEIEQTEDAIRKRKAEIEDLQGELEKANKETIDLQKQKTESQGRLDELDKEKLKYEELLSDIQQKCQDEAQKLSNLRNQISTQETSVKGQEEELLSARTELNSLRQEETKLEEQAQTVKMQLEQMTKQFASTKNEMNQVRTKIAKLSEENQSIHASINQYSSMASSIVAGNSASAPLPIADNLGSLPENLEATFSHSDVDTISARATAGSSPVSSISGFSVGSGRVDEAAEDFKDTDPFKPKSDVFSGNESENTDPFNSEDPFKPDPFKSVSFADDPFAGDPFQEDKDPFPSEDEKSQDDHDDPDPFKSDPFKPTSAVPSSSASSLDYIRQELDLPGNYSGNRPSAPIADPFSSLDPFGCGAFAAPKPSKSSNINDPFSSDPFAPVASLTTASSNSMDTKHISMNGSSSKSHDLFADPFGPSDPFSSRHSDPFASSGQPSLHSDDPWAAFTDTNNTPSKAPLPSSEEEQLAWAKIQSQKEEQERQNMLQALSDKEEMDVALALKQSVESSSEA